MYDPFLVQALFYFLPQIIVLIFLTRAFYSYEVLYRKKKNPDYTLHGEAAEYIFKSPKHFFKFYLTPFFWWKIIFEHHKDKQLDTAAKRIRRIFLCFFGVVIVESTILVFFLLNQWQKCILTVYFYFCLDYMMWFDLDIMQKPH